MVTIFVLYDNKIFLTKMVPKTKKEASVPLKAKVKVFKPRRPWQKGPQTQTEDQHVTYLPAAQDPGASEITQILSKDRRNKSDHHAIFKFSKTTVAARKTDITHAYSFVGIKANKRQIKQAVKTLYGTDMAKVNTLLWPNGEKKAYPRLAPDSDALGNANKMRSSKSSPSVDYLFNYSKMYCIC